MQLFKFRERGPGPQEKLPSVPNPQEAELQEAQAGGKRQCEKAPLALVIEPSSC
ncbi:hypothetical protein [Pelagicoccus sp. SDUM812002]|uniref:hypothetical protein n=1 Tax=Pelagicoccus sp. SDUM812002 TaxID=3041266 RepID=UPI00281186C2|nr:hypothetical protein [Pelagicoccus sp. SDUM812002]